MGWVGTVLTSVVLSGVLSAIIAALFARARDTSETTNRREDVRRERLTDALVDFLAADRPRFEASWDFYDAIRRSFASLSSDQQAHVNLQNERATTTANLLQRMAVAANAAQRIQLYAPGLYALVEAAQRVGKYESNQSDPLQVPDIKGSARKAVEYQDKVDALLAAARQELGLPVQAPVQAPAQPEGGQAAATG